MFQLGSKIFWTVILCIIAWNNSFSANQKTVYIERFLNLNSTLTSSNPSFMKDFNDEGWGTVKSFYNFGKGDFVNYFSPNQFYKAGLETQSYKRLNDKTVVYGFASYDFSKGKNSNGTSFYDPYRTPFNFNELDEETKGDRQIERYNLAGALSHQISDKISLGAKIDYKTVSLAKLKDIRNTNDILDLFVAPGLTYKISQTQTLGFSYTYNRYIENMIVEEYGEIDRDYIALVNKGAFMGSIILYGSDGILKEDSKRPWVDITHQPAIQYNIYFSEDVNLFVDLSYRRAIGYFGEEGDADVVFMRHKENGGELKSKLSITKKNCTHIIALQANYNSLSNKEQLYNQVKTSGGNTITEYYGQSETLKRTKANAHIEYWYLWGDHYFNAPWQFNAKYSVNNLKRTATHYPFYRKQDIYIHNVKLGISRIIHSNKFDYKIKFSNQFTTGNGGNPIDGTYVSTSGSTKTPDYQDDLLYVEKEYLTASKITSGLNIRIEHNYKQDFMIFYELDAAITKPFNTEYLKGSFYNIGLNIGLIF